MNKKVKRLREICDAPPRDVERLKAAWLAEYSVTSEEWGIFGQPGKQLIADEIARAWVMLQWKAELSVNTPSVIPHCIQRARAALDNEIVDLDSFRELYLSWYTLAEECQRIFEIVLRPFDYSAVELQARLRWATQAVELIREKRETRDE